MYKSFRCVSQYLYPQRANDSLRNRVSQWSGNALILPMSLPSRSQQSREPEESSNHRSTHCLKQSHEFHDTRISPIAVLPLSGDLSFARVTRNFSVWTRSSHRSGLKSRIMRRIDDGKPENGWWTSGTTAPGKPEQKSTIVKIGGSSISLSLSLSPPSLSLSLFLARLSRAATITFTRLDYLTVTPLNYPHELINKLGQVNLARRSLNIRRP